MHNLFLVATTITLATACSIGDAGFTTGPSNQGVVTGQAVMVLSTNEVWMQNVKEGQTVSQDLIIQSTGDIDLNLHTSEVVDDGQGAFYADEAEGSDVVVSPGMDAEVTVVCTMTNNERKDGLLRIDSNDIANPTLDVPLICTPVGWAEDTGLDSGT